MPRSCQSERRNLATRPLRMEDLERRIVLASDVGVESAAVESVPTESVETVDTFVLDAIVVRVNGDEQLLRNNDLLQLNRGDVLQVVRIDYATQRSLDGVLAAEGYVHKLAPNGQGAGEFDYSDGRFGAGESIALGTGIHAGLEGSWVVDEGWDRLAVTAVRYGGNESQVEGVIHVRLQVGEPDFRIDESFVEAVRSTLFEVGTPVDFSGLWENSGAGRFHNYMEIDVVDVTDDEVYEWVGVLVGNASQESPVAGSVDNQNADDPFAAVWTPSTTGDYLIILAVDPEELWDESDETNNFLRLSVQVSEPDAPLQRTLVFSASFEDSRLKEGKSNFVKRTDGFEVRGRHRAELQRNLKTVGAASDGDVLLELDGTRNTSVYRSFPAQPGERFAVELDYSPRPGVAADSNIIEVVFDGEVIATLSRDGRELKETAFETVSLDLPVAVASEATLELRAAGQSDRVGGLLDHVRVFSLGVQDQVGRQVVAADAREEGDADPAQPLSTGDQECFVRDLKERLLDGLRARLSPEAVANVLPTLDDLELTEVCELADSYGLNVEQQLRDFDAASAFRSKHDWWSSDDDEARWWDSLFDRP